MLEKPYISLEQAEQQLLKHVRPVGVCVRIALPKAAGRILYEDVHAKIAQPPFDRSPLDGYAMLHTDIAKASRDRPIRLCVSQRIYAGDFPQSPLKAGSCAQIMTGAPLPKGATTVVRQEDVEIDDGDICVFKPQPKFENYCFAGEDVKSGQLLFRKGMSLDAAMIGVLAGQGMAKIKVYRKTRIGILSTGSELAALGIPLEPGQIYDCNQYMLAARTQILGGKAILTKSIGDNPEGIALALGGMLEKCDFVVTTGGVSVGQHDFMPTVGRLIGAEELFHGVAIKPGSPMMALLKGEKLILCLSGNPFAAAATFELLAAAVIRTLAGSRNPHPVKLSGRLDGEFSKSGQVRRFLRAHIEGASVTLPGHGHASGKLSAMAGCNCLIDIPVGSPPLCKGDSVEVILF